MARPQDWETSPLYKAAACFVDSALRKQDSMFTPGKAVWSEGPVEDFYRRFVVNSDETAASFEEKLRRQLADAPSETAQLAAELLYVYLLPANRARGKFKRGLINVALGLHGLLMPAELDAALDQGMVSEGQGFHQQRFHYLRYLLEFVRTWWKHAPDERERGLIDPWAFKKMASEINTHACQSQVEILLHIVHPDAFEDILSQNHKRQIAAALADLVDEPTDDPDRQLLIIRRKLVEQGKEVKYYEQPLCNVWQAKVDSSNDPTGTMGPISPTVRYWKIAPGENARLWADCRTGGYISLGWDELGDLSAMDRAQFEAAQARAIIEHTAFTEKGTDQVWTFAKQIKPGDRIVANQGMFKVVGVGTVTGSYMYVGNAVEYRHRLPVRWDDVRPRKVNQRGWRPTIMELDKEQFDQISRSLVELDEPTALQKLLLARKNVVLYGPPGTGKTHAAFQLARAWADQNAPDSVWQVTFHPSFAYEDFIEGFRPAANGKFELRKGIFVQAAEAARTKPDVPFLLVIDELNRGDVARLFGELITLIEADKRREEMQRKLPYSQLDFWVPPNLHLLGTMNTADRSISLLDIAIRRRFCFLEYRPEGDVIRSSTAHYQDVAGIDLAGLMDAINARLSRIGIDRDRAIGHCHFLIPREHSDPLGLLRERLRYDIIPLVEEYCYADRARMREVFGKLVGEDGRGNDGIISNDELLSRELVRIAGADEAAVLPEGNGDGLPPMDQN